MVARNEILECKSHPLRHFGLNLGLGEPRMTKLFQSSGPSL